MRCYFWTSPHSEVTMYKEIVNLNNSECFYNCWPEISITDGPCHFNIKCLYLISLLCFPQRLLLTLSTRPCCILLSANNHCSYTPARLFVCFCGSVAVLLLCVGMWWEASQGRGLCCAVLFCSMHAISVVTETTACLFRQRQVRVGDIQCSDRYKSHNEQTNPEMGNTTNNYQNKVGDVLWHFLDSGQPEHRPVCTVNIPLVAGNP